MTPKELLALCRDAGYEGDADRLAVKAWFEGDDSPIELRDRKNAQLKFDDVWPATITHKGITLSISTNEGAPDTVEVVDAATKMDEEEEPMPPAEDEPEEEKAATRAVDTKAAQVRGIEGKMTNKAFSIGRPETKAYQAKINRAKSGGFRHIKDRAVFDDVDKAECAGATLRWHVARAGGVYDYPQKSRDEDIMKKGAVEGVNAQGGVLVPQDYVPELIVLLDEYGAARQLCNFRGTSRDVVEMPRRTADPTVAWTGEATASSDQDPAYDLVSITAKKLQGVMYVSNELLNDSAISVVDDLFNGFANGIANKEDSAFFLGDGTSTYGGIVGLASALGSAGTNEIASTWATATDAQLQAGLGLLPSYAHNAGGLKITCTPSHFYNTYNRLAHAAGGITYLESQTGVVKPAYNGIPVVFNNVMASATAVSTISSWIGNFDMAAKCIEVTGSLEFATSEHYRFLNDQITLRARERVGITVHDAGDSSNAGPVVANKTAAS